MCAKAESGFVHLRRSRSDRAVNPFELFDQISGAMLDKNERPGGLDCYNRLLDDPGYSRV